MKSWPTLEIFPIQIVRDATQPFPSFVLGRHIFSLFDIYSKMKLKILYLTMDLPRLVCWSASLDF